MKVIPDPIHGILDYLAVPIFGLALRLLGFGGVAALISYGLAGIHLAMTLLTDMPLGPVKLIPMKLHALVAMIVGPVLILAASLLPAIFDGGREFFLAMGFVSLADWFRSIYG